MNRDIKNALMRQEDYNIIVVDWSFSSSPYYPLARNRVYSVGVVVARFVEFLREYGTIQMELIGFDLGAHVAGIAGKNTRRRINRITGLDPSAQLFNLNDYNQRLSAGDSEYTVAYHSNGGYYGIAIPIADVDIFINNGRNQPDCTSKK